MNVRRAGADALSKLSWHGNIYLISDLNIVDVLFVAVFRESIRDAIPTIITLLRSWESDMGVNSLEVLSEQGKVSNFLS